MDLFKKKSKKESLKDNDKEQQAGKDLASTNSVYESKEGTVTDAVEKISEDIKNGPEGVQGEGSAENFGITQEGDIKGMDVNSENVSEQEKAKQFENPDLINNDAEFDGSEKELLSKENIERIDVIVKNENGNQSILEGEESQEPKELNPQNKSITEVIGLRILIDETIQFAEVSLGKRNNVSISLFKSKAWLGKLLEQLGTLNPYLTEKPVRRANEIPKTADVAQGIAKLIYDFKLNNDVEQIVSLREMVRLNIDKVESLDISMDFIKDKRLAAIAKTQSYVNLCEARFELGYELSLIRDKNK